MASSVLPTPVGPANRKLPIGFSARASPARARLMAAVTVSTALSWPKMTCLRPSSRCCSTSRSSLDTDLGGIRAMRAMTSSTSGVSTRMVSSSVSSSPSAASPSSGSSPSRSITGSSPLLSASSCFSSSPGGKALGLGVASASFLAWDSRRRTAAPVSSITSMALSGQVALTQVLVGQLGAKPLIQCVGRCTRRCGVARRPA